MDKVLVLIQMDGGNDALNTVIPMSQYSAYKTNRPTLAIPETKVLKLSNPAIGLHPSLTAFQAMFEEGKMGMIQGVGIDPFNLSHFKQTDIIHSGSNENEVWNSGIWGRLFEPMPANPHPYGIRIGATPVLSMQGESKSYTMTLTSDRTLYDFADDNDPSPDTPGGKTAAYIRDIMRQTEAYAAEVKKAGDRVTSQLTYPQDHPTFGEQLKTVARLIAGGLTTQVYVVTLDGFDTHSSQASGIDSTVGHHAQRLQWLNDAVSVFMKDLEALGVADRVLCMTYSEFGRSAKQNGSNGTDHGCAGLSFVFGKSLESNKVWGSFDMTKNEMAPVYDVRQVWSEVMRLWLNADPVVALRRSFDNIGFIKIPPTKKAIMTIYNDNTWENII